MHLNPVKAIKYQLYLFQLENYRIGRFFRVAARNFCRPALEQRKELVWTLKVVYLLILAALLQCAIVFIGAIGIYKITNSIILSAFSGIFIFYSLSLLFFFFILIISAILYYPLDFIFKKRIIRKAKSKASEFPRVKVVAIAGSYGKTTMKEVLAALLSEKFNVLKTPENINTPLGISRLISKKLDSGTDIMVIEMGAYKKGDIQKLCEIIRPDIGILTGINESHLERFGKIENTIAAKFEIADNIKQGGAVMFNTDDSLVMKNYKVHLSGQSAFFYGSGSSVMSYFRVMNKKFLDNGLGLAFELWKDGVKKYDVKTPFLGEYIISTITGAIVVAEQLGLSEGEIIRGLAALKPVAHRLEPIRTANDILVIDDSYNGNPNGAREAIKVLGRFKSARKIYLTPGLVETAGKTEEIHYILGKQLSDAANMVILIRNRATEAMARGLADSGFAQENIRWFPTPQKAHSALSGLLKQGDIILFQNDLPDNYL